MVGTQGFVGFDLKRAGAHYGTYPELLCELHLEYVDGAHEVVASDEHWRATTGPIRYSDLLHGEYYDARRELDGWTDPGYDDGDWGPYARKIATAWHWCPSARSRSASRKRCRRSP